MAKLKTIGSAFIHLKRYSQFLLQNHLDALATETIERSRQNELPFFSYLENYKEPELMHIYRNGYSEQILIPLIQNQPYEKMKQKIEAWKDNTTIIPKECLQISDITSIHNIRRDVLLDFLKFYECTREDLVDLIKEINRFFDTCIDLGLKAYEEIHTTELVNKNKLLSGILSTIPLIVTKLDKEGKILFSAGAGLKSIGLKDQDLSGKNIFEVDFNEYTRKALDGSPTSFVAANKSVTGEMREFQNFFVPEKDGALGFSIDITKQREAEEQFSNFVDGVKDYAIFLLQPDGTIASWNEGARNLKGYSKEEVIGKHFSIFYTEEKRQEKFPEYELEQAKKHGRFEDEGWRVKKDGSVFWANVVITANYTKDKQLLNFTKITRDLSERRSTEERLRQSEEKYRNLIDGVRDYAIFLLTPEGKVASWNEGARTLKGYNKEEILGKHFSVFYPEEKRKEKFPEFELEVAEKAGSYEDEGIRIRKDGSTFWANVVITAIYNERKELIGFTKITRDLTERKRTEETLRRSEERYRLLIEAVKDYAIFVLNPEGIITTWNEGAKRLKGYSEDEIIGKHISIFYTQDKIDQNYAQYELEQAKKYGRFEDEGIRIRKDGSSFYANVIITALFDNDNKHIGFSKITRDLTERKRNEEKLQKVNHELEEKVKERTEELLKTIKELKRINNDLDNFIYTASHDLRAPISNLEGLIYGLYEEIGDQMEHNPNFATFKELISTSITTFQSTIKELTEIAKIQKEASENTEGVQIDELVDEVKTNIAELISKNNAQIVLNMNGCDTLQFVKKNLKSIFYNLISNGIKYRSPDRDPVISIRCSFTKDYQLISFEDNGLGVKEEHKGKIFEMFKRVHDHVEGTGLGLYIVKRILENAGGKIEVESKVGEGSKFKIYLPK